MNSRIVRDFVTKSKETQSDLLNVISFVFYFYDLATFTQL